MTVRLSLVELMETIRKQFPILLVIVSCLSLCAPIFAQEQIPQKQAGPAVRLNLIITDHSNHSLDDVRQEEIQILEGKVPQTLSVFQKDERPVDYVIAIDASGSFKDLLAPALDAAKTVIDGNRQGDEALLMSFISSDKINTISAFTSDKSKLIDSLKRFKTGMGQSAVIDAIYVAVKAAAEYNAVDSTVRRAVILVSDGEDRQSYYNTDALVKLLQATNVQVFVIGIVTQLDDQNGIIRPSPRAIAETLLKRVAQESGGRLFFSRSHDDLTRATAEIVHDLHTQYLVGYQSTNSDSKENFRKIQVKVVRTPGPELTAITRPGYFINPPVVKENDKKKSKG